MMLGQIDSSIHAMNNKPHTPMKKKEEFANDDRSVRNFEKATMQVIQNNIIDNKLKEYE